MKYILAQGSQEGREEKTFSDSCYRWQVVDKKSMKTPC